MNGQDEKDLFDNNVLGNLFFSLIKIYYNINYLKEIEGQTLDLFITYKIKKILIYKY